MPSQGAAAFARGIARRHLRGAGRVAPLARVLLSRPRTVVRQVHAHLALSLRVALRAPKRREGVRPVVPVQTRHTTPLAVSGRIDTVPSRNVMPTPPGPVLRSPAVARRPVHAAVRREAVTSPVPRSAPAVARVMRRATIAPSPAPEEIATRPAPFRAEVRAALPAAGLPGHEVERLTEQVVHALDRRLLAFRERQGRT